MQGVLFDEAVRPHDLAGRLFSHAGGQVEPRPLSANGRAPGPGSDYAGGAAILLRRWQVYKSVVDAVIQPARERNIPVYVVSPDNTDNDIDDESVLEMVERGVVPLYMTPALRAGQN
jgi:hypothetical protein